ncbi:hypothetical protein [Micromonospora globispora]|uniref:hypothetical protein n=1 Tax=Micromonospora globispora TaxID=1450148 RepID=UPI000F4DA3F9|nr:hypothetical protein [Micromonospora globispora]
MLTVLSSGYFTVSGLVRPGALVSGGEAAAARTYAAYLAARSIVLLGALMWLLVVRAWRALGLLLGLNGAVQLIDAAIGAAHHQIAQTVGPICFAVALFIAARKLGALTLTPGQPAGPADHSSPVSCQCAVTVPRL